MGSRTLVHASLWGTKEEANGKFLSSCKVKKEAAYTFTDEGRLLEKRLWVGAVGGNMVLFYLCSY
jgi:hypothetical protein